MQIIKTISASSYNCYQECPYRWQLQYIYKLIQPEIEAFVIGRMYHQGVEMFHNGHSTQDAIESVRKLMLVEPTQSNISNFGLVRLMLEKYYEDPIMTPTIESEYKFCEALSLAVNGQYPLPPLFGFIDRVVEGGIIEHKTSSFDYTEEHTSGIQTDIYAYAYYKKYGNIPKVTYHVMNKTKVKKKGYKPQVIELTKSIDDFDKMKGKLLIFYDNVINKRYNATPGKHCNWCAYKASCDKRYARQ